MPRAFVESVCTSCERGRVSFAVAQNGETIVLMCDECDAVWLHPNRVRSEAPTFVEGSEHLLPGTSIKLGSNTRWARQEEVLTAGWASFIAGEAE